MSAVAVLAMLVSKVLQKARELSTKLFNTEPKRTQTPKQEPVQHPPEKEMEIKSKIPPKFVMSAEAASKSKGDTIAIRTDCTGKRQRGEIIAP